MAQDPTETAAEELLSPRRLAPSAAILGAHIALTAALGTEGVAGTEHDQQTIDLLLRLRTSRDDGARAVELSQQLMISPSHMSRVIDKVEACGLVERTPDPADRRANRIVITPNGREVLAAVAPHIAATLDRAIHDTLSPEELTTLIGLLGRIEHAARATPAL
ncbi:MAG: MarR family winged helix-turn-helix transcriptional regulator [Acidimicrobiales bacterium]